MSEPQDYEQLLARIGRPFRTVRDGQRRTDEEFVAITSLEVLVITGIESGELSSMSRRLS